MSNDSSETGTNSNIGSKPIAFLDRDGVLNVDIGYLYRAEDLKWTDDAPEAVRWLNERGIPVVVVTNQSGIGRGIYSEEMFHELMRAMKEGLEERGAHLDGYYFCPHHPTDALEDFRFECDCRKPKPGMILAGLRDFGGDPARSFFVGDKDSDMGAAAAAGVMGVRFSGGSLLAAIREAAATLQIG